ncbi:MAG: anti-phage ZorAB system protein ZorA [Bauldia sp.]
MEMGPLDAIVDWLFGILDPIFSQRYVAPVIILPAMLVAATLLIVHAGTRARPFYAAADRRIKALSAAVGTSGDPAQERADFAAAFPDLAAVLRTPQRGAEPLVRAWNEFDESIIDVKSSPIRNTSRPQVFFARAIPQVGHLAFWSNVFVGVGLLLTFVGIVVALNTAGAGMEGGTQEDTQFALQELLAVAGAKFFASIAGLIASIVLRFADAHYQRKLKGKVERIAQLLERGMLYVPPQLLASQQLEELRRQSAELGRFHTDLAGSIGAEIAKRFEGAMAPVSTSLGALSERLSDFTDRVGDGLGRGAAQAVTAAASGELRALGATLEGIGGQIDRAGRNVNGSGEDVARQIRLAGEDFATAARDIREAFASLRSDVDGVGRSLIERNETMAAAQSSTLEAALAAFNAKEADAAEALADAVRRLGDASDETSKALQSSLAASLHQSLDDIQSVLRQSIVEAGAEFGRAGAELSASVRGAVDRIEEFTASIERSREGADGVAAAFKGTAAESAGAAGSLAVAAAGFAAAAEPVVQSAQALGVVSDRLAATAAEQARAGSEAVESLKTLAAGIRATEEAAADAWRDYRARFEGVDQSLAQSLDRMGGALADALQQLRDFAGKIDQELATAVLRLATPLDAIQESGEAIRQFAASVRPADREAAE